MSPNERRRGHKRVALSHRSYTPARHFLLCKTQVNLLVTHADGTHNHDGSSLRFEPIRFPKINTGQSDLEKCSPTGCSLVGAEDNDESYTCNKDIFF